MMKWIRVSFVALFTIAFAVFFAFAMVLALTSCSSSAQSAKVQKAEADMCKLRADYKLANAAAGGLLSATPGSPRAALEQAEDIVCASRSPDGGP